MVVAHNLTAINANRQLGIVTTRKSKATEKLSSGYKINRAADDAAGLAISEKMRRQIRGLTQASANAQDGISMLQIADGAMNEIQDMVHRGTELCVQAANGTLTDTDREYIQAEIAQLKEEIDRVHERTTFNEIPVLQGSHFEITASGSAAVVGGLPAWVTLGSTNGQMSEVFEDTKAYTDPAGSTANIPMKHAAATLDFSSFDGSQQKLDELDGQGFHFTCCTCDKHYSVIFNKDNDVKSVKSSGNHYVYTVGIQGAVNAADILGDIIVATGGNPTGHYTNLKPDYTNGILTIYDDRSMESDTTVFQNYNQNNPTATVAPGGTWSGWTYKQFSVAARGDYGKFGPGVAYDPADVTTTTNSSVSLQIGAEAWQILDLDLPHVSCDTLSIAGVDASTADGAQNGINSFEKATLYLNGERSRVGAYQNRLEHTIKNLDNVVENTTAAESQIRDTDMAKEMVGLSVQNILQQAGQAMLSQANQSQQGILSLIQ